VEDALPDDETTPSRVSVRCDDCGDAFLMATEDFDSWPEDDPRRCERCLRISQVSLEEVWSRGGLKAS